MPTTIPDSHADLLADATKATDHLATIGPDGVPQSTPIWFLWDGSTIKMSTTNSRQKYRNVTRDPKVALSMTDPTNPYRYLEVRGEILQIDDDPDKSFIDATARKYLGTDYPWNQPGDERVVLVMEPRHVTTMG